MYSTRSLSLGLLAAIATGSAQAALEWQNVRIGGGGGFVSGIIFHPKSEGIAYARTDIGGLYRLNTTTDTYIPLTDKITTDEGWWVHTLFIPKQCIANAKLTTKSTGTMAVSTRWRWIPKMTMWCTPQRDCTPRIPRQY